MPLRTRKDTFKFTKGTNPEIKNKLAYMLDETVAVP
jgi:hypothetical protein